MTPRVLKLTCGLLLLALGGCQTSKSSSPTAPTVAGPIPGVTISAPVLLQPSQGFKFKESEQPIKLVVQNATTNGVRALSYTFEVAADTAFNTKVFSRSSVPPGDGKTTVTLDRLEIGRTYYWRAWAEDGANTGTTSTAGFEIYPKASVGAPTAASPANNEQVATVTPTIIAGNAVTAGPVGFLSYEFQVATNQAFTALVAAGIVNEGSGHTAFNSSPLAGGTTFFWRVRAGDSESISAWSNVQTFRTTPTAPPPPPPPPGGGGGTGSCDALVDQPEQLVKCIHASMPSPPRNEVEAFEVTKRVAWALRNKGGGLLIKNGGENIVSWQGYSFSASRVCFPDGHIYKVISDAGPGGANGPTWSDNDFVDRALYVPAIDPSKR